MQAIWKSNDNLNNSKPTSPLNCYVDASGHLYLCSYVKLTVFVCFSMVKVPAHDLGSSHFLCKYIRKFLISVSINASNELLLVSNILNSKQKKIGDSEWGCKKFIISKFFYLLGTRNIESINTCESYKETRCLKLGYATNS